MLPFTDRAVFSMDDVLGLVAPGEEAAGHDRFVLGWEQPAESLLAFDLDRPPVGDSYGVNCRFWCCHVRPPQRALRPVDDELSDALSLLSTGCVLKPGE